MDARPVSIKIVKLLFKFFLSWSEGLDSELRSVKIHDKDAFAAMRKAGQLAAETLDFIYEYVQPGVTTDHLDKL